MKMGVAEVANTMSFPELFLVLKTAQKKERQQLHVLATAQMLAACAPWEKQAAKNANKFLKLLAQDTPEASPENSANELIQMLSASGVPITQE